MSGKRSTTDVTDPGQPPEEALDTNLRAFSAPVTAEAREAAESKGLDAARYYAHPHAPARALDRVDDTEPMAGATHEVDAAPSSSGPVRERTATTVPRGVPKERAISTFPLALAFVLVMLGVVAWVLTRNGAPRPSPATGSTSRGSTLAATSSTSGAGSVGAMAPPSGPLSTTPSVVAPSAIASARAALSRVGGPTPKATASTTPRASSSLAPSAPSAPRPPTAPTTQYNRFLEEDEQ